MKHLRGSILWGAAEAVVALFTAIVVSLAAGRIIGPEAFGLGSLAFLIVTLAETIIAMPFSEALVRRPTWSTRLIDAAFTGTLITGLLVFVALQLLAPLFAEIYGEPELTWLIRVQALTCLLLGVRGIPEAVFARKLRFKVLSRCNMSAKIVGGTLTIVLALAGFGAWCVVLGNVAFALVAAICMLAFQTRKPRIRPHWNYTKELTGFGVFSVADSFLGAATPRVFNALLGYFYGVVPVGQTSIAFRINDGVAALLSMITVRLALPVMSRVAHDKARLAQMLQQGTRMIFLVTAPVFVGLAFVSDDLISVLLGPGWEGAATALIAVNCFSLLHFACVLVAATVKALGHPGRWVMVQAIGVPFTGLGTIAMATAGFGIEGPLLVWVMFGVAYFVAALSVLRWTAGIGFAAQFQPLARITFACAGMALALLTIDVGLAIDPLIDLFAKIAVGALTYLALIWVLETSTLRTMIRPTVQEA